MHRGSTFEAALEKEAAGLDSVDRRLAHEIAAGVLRSQTELDGELAPLVSRRWQSTPQDLKDILRIGAHQLLKLNRVPAYAVVHSAVDVAREAHGPGGARFVNAVLRRLAREPDRKPPAHAAADLATRYSHPVWLVTRWTERFGRERTEIALRHNNRRPPITIQAVRSSEEDLLRALSQRGIDHRPAKGGYGIVVETSNVSSLPGFEEGAFVVQDAGAARLLEHCRIPNGALVWDTCAAPGGKAALLSRRCSVVASEFNESRLPRLRDNLRRTAPDVPVLAADARTPPFRAECFDAVLVDAPCSATGVIARHPDARWRLRPKRIERLAALQRQILDRASSAVRPGGLLAYITCSLEPEENEEQVAAFLERHEEFDRAGADLTLLPGEDQSDGGYAARMKKAA